MTAAGIGIFALSAGKWPGNTFFCQSYKYNLTPGGVSSPLKEEKFTKSGNE